jgi:universal stress protein A
MRIKQILAPVDFSGSATVAVDYAVEMARLHKAELLLAHIIEPMNYAVPRFYPEPTALLEEQRKHAAMQLSEFELRVRKRYRKCRSEVHFGVVYEMIVQLAASIGADLIVIATHGRTGLAHVLMGSVAEKVVRYAECPVLTIRTVPMPAGLRGKRRKPRARTVSS